MIRAMMLYMIFLCYFMESNVWYIIGGVLLYGIIGSFWCVMTFTPKEKPRTLIDGILGSGVYIFAPILWIIFRNNFQYSEED